MRIRWLCTLLVVVGSTVALCQAPGTGSGGTTGGGSTGGNPGGNTGNTGFPGMIGSTRSVPSGVELQIRVAWPDNRPVDGTIHLRLINAYGAIIQDVFTAREGMASFRAVRAGTYTIQVGGPDVEDSTTEPIQIFESSGVMMHWITVKPRDPNRSVGGLPGGNVSASEMSVPNKARKEMDKGLHAMGKNDLTEATDHFRKAVEIYPKFARAWNNLGVVKARENDRTGAVEMWDKALEADDKFVPAYFNKARLEILNHKNDAAEELIRKGLSMDPNHPEGLFLLANTQYANGQWNLALETANRLHKIEHKRFSDIHIIAAQSLMQQRQHKLALDELEIFLKESPDSPKVAQVRKQMAQLQAILRQDPARLP
ncbi:MAG TPA: tetratricopeptide repeat protein [Terriglobales bacterium]|nr:tetratricopeptide repeat protein [Terriglobales bacterium]